MTLACAAVDAAQRNPAVQANRRIARSEAHAARALHDELWRARGVEVVRPGIPGPPIGETAFQLLLDRNELAAFEFGVHIQRRAWARSRIALVALSFAHAAYGEEVLADAEGRVIGVRRRYRAEVEPASRACITTSPAIAGQWRTSTDARQAWFALRAAVGVQVDAPLEVTGVACDAGDDAGRARVIEWLQREEHASDVRPNAAKPWAARSRTKRAFDVAFSLIALLLVLPLFPVVMLAIWLEDGRPVFFGHRRQCEGGREFTCWKFRTMCADAERHKASLSVLNKADGPQFHVDADPRLLRVGRWLRRFHIDELPQFWNVLRGEMSVVGPRPSPESENRFCPAWREARLSVRPGVTGLWQVRRTRAQDEDFQEWIHYDIAYVRRASWLMDLGIIGKTLAKMIVR
jgi:lipopolysaccharide/colanic/teichoic acid biosynthesis glycosyltransferase